MSDWHERDAHAPREQRRGAPTRQFNGALDGARVGHQQPTIREVRDEGAQRWMHAESGWKEYTHRRRYALGTAKQVLEA